jgi:hypothetical protein
LLVVFIVIIAALGVLDVPKGDGSQDTVAGCVLKLLTYVVARSRTQPLVAA